MSSREFLIVVTQDGDMDGENKKHLNSLSFIMMDNPKWDKKIASGLRKECGILMGLKENFKTHSIYVTSGEVFAGGISIEQHGDILWIDSLWIEPLLRKQGIGKMLIAKIMYFAVAAKVKEVQLNTYFPEAHTFFLACGFEDVAAIPKWKYGLTCYLMRKKL